MGFDIHALAIVLKHDIAAGVQLIDREYAKRGEHLYIFLIEKVRHTVRCCPIVQESALFRRLLNPGVIITVAVEDDSLVVTDCFLDHFVQGFLKVFGILESVGINSQALGDRTVQHDVGAGDAVGGAEHTELEFVSCECKR